MKHENEIVVMLECLAFHARDRFEVFGGIWLGEQLCNFVLHEAESARCVR